MAPSRESVVAYLVAMGLDPQIKRATPNDEWSAYALHMARLHDDRVFNRQIFAWMLHERGFCSMLNVRAVSHREGRGV